MAISSGRQESLISDKSVLSYGSGRDFSEITVPLLVVAGSNAGLNLLDCIFDSVCTECGYYLRVVLEATNSLARR